MGVRLVLRPDLPEHPGRPPPGSRASPSTSGQSCGCGRPRTRLEARLARARQQRGRQDTVEERAHRRWRGQPSPERRPRRRAPRGNGGRGGGGASWPRPHPQRADRGLQGPSRASGGSGAPAAAAGTAAGSDAWSAAHARVSRPGGRGRSQGKGSGARRTMIARRIDLGAASRATRGRSRAWGRSAPEENGHAASPARAAERLVAADASQERASFGALQQGRVEVRVERPEQPVAE